MARKMSSRGVLFRFFRLAFLLVLCFFPALSTAGEPLAPPALLIDAAGENAFADERVDVARLRRGLKVLGFFFALGSLWTLTLQRRVATKTRQLQELLAETRQGKKVIDGLNAELQRTRSEIAFVLGEVIEGRSHETAHHVRRVAAMTEWLARKSGRPDDVSSLIGLASAFHDVGKITIPDDLLNKPGRLTPEEFEIVKTHTTAGYRILSASGGPLFELAATIALEHHEKWDGSGYPQGLSGEAISYEARLVAIVDVFDALAGRRPYKAPWPLDRIVHTLIGERGRHFDPAVVDLFLDNLDCLLDVCRNLPNRGGEEMTGERTLSKAPRKRADLPRIGIAGPFGPPGKG